MGSHQQRHSEECVRIRACGARGPCAARHVVRRHGKRALPVAGRRRALDRDQRCPAARTGQLAADSGALPRSGRGDVRARLLDRRRHVASARDGRHDRAQAGVTAANARGLPFPPRVDADGLAGFARQRRRSAARCHDQLHRCDHCDRFDGEGFCEVPRLRRDGRDDPEVQRRAGETRTESRTLGSATRRPAQSEATHRATGQHHPPCAGLATARAMGPGFAGRTGRAARGAGYLHRGDGVEG